MADSLEHIAARAPVNGFAARQITRGDENYALRGMLEAPPTFPDERTDTAVAHGLVDLRGKAFGQLTVLGVAVEPGPKGLQWVCRCTCNRYEFASRKRLERGRGHRCAECQSTADMRRGLYGNVDCGPKSPPTTQVVSATTKSPSPGSLRVPAWLAFRDSVCPSLRRVAEDQELIGRRFGRIACVGQSTHERGGRKKELLYVCQCECGGFVLRLPNSLKGGSAPPCPVCITRDRARGLHSRNEHFEKLMNPPRPRHSGAKKGVSRDARCDRDHGADGPSF